MLVAIAGAQQAVTGADQRPLWALDAAGTRQALAELAGLASRVAELEAQLLRHADAVAAYLDQGATSVANGLGHTTRITRREARGKTRLAKALEAHPLTREALARGEVRVEQATVICHAVDELAQDLAADAGSDEEAVRDLAADPDLSEQAEKHLLAAAEHHDAKALRLLGVSIRSLALATRPPNHRARYSTTEPSLVE